MTNVFGRGAPLETPFSNASTRFTNDPPIEEIKNPFRRKPMLLPVK